ncbi:HD-GYP domain-containing protein [Paenibacillus sp. FJAT-26967]|uniref:HD-GYP domain-containing protein n=1 Tax=Paenibacillus sp. FJAT-26967 TaxID=1729690 RepID=UPI000837E9D8|nr:HD-GYP domain-containing protein [Paenibacillus sp. FJAT-26967]
MRLFPISMCRAGMKLGKHIYNEQGMVLLAEGVELTQPLLDRLDRHGINYLYIQDSLTDDIVHVELISEENKNKLLREIRSSFRKLANDPGRRTLASYHHFGKTFRLHMDSLIEDLSRHGDAMIMLSDIQIKDNYLYQHSLNVCMYATMLGMSHGYGKDELMTLGLGALLHDIGKTQIPDEILCKPTQLSDSEFTEMQNHTVYGYRILKEEPNIPLLSAHCAFQHHERMNGSGYPRGIKGDEIHPYAKWIAMVDSYDALTTHRVYRPALLPHEALEVIMGGANTLYDPDMVNLFRDKVAIYPLGVTVSLCTGEIGVVVDLNASMPQRPVIRIIENQRREPLKVPYEVDLSKQLSIMITSINPT